MTNATKVKEEETVTNRPSPTLTELQHIFLSTPQATASKITTEFNTSNKSQQEQNMRVTKPELQGGYIAIKGVIIAEHTWQAQWVQ